MYDKKKIRDLTYLYLFFMFYLCTELTFISISITFTRWRDYILRVRKTGFKEYSLGVRVWSMYIIVMYVYQCISYVRSYVFHYETHRNCISTIKTSLNVLDILFKKKL